MTPVEKRLFIANFKKNQCANIARRYEKETKWDWLWTIVILGCVYFGWRLVCGIWG